MKTFRLSVCAAALVAGFSVGFLGCASDIHVSGGAAVHYGPFRFWFYDGPWLNGYHWWHEGIVIHPPPIVVNRPAPWPRLPHHPRPGVHHGR